MLMLRGGNSEDIISLEYFGAGGRVIAKEMPRRNFNRLARKLNQRSYYLKFSIDPETGREHYLYHSPESYPARFRNYISNLTQELNQAFNEMRNVWLEEYWRGRTIL